MGISVTIPVSFLICKKKDGTSMLVRHRCRGIIISGLLTLGDKKMGNIRIVTLMDNQNGERKDLAAEHGLSLYIETGYANILFDFGQ